MKVVLHRPSLYHFGRVILVPGPNEVSEKVFVQMRKNKVVSNDFDLGILEEVSDELPEEKPTPKKRSGSKKKPKKVERTIEADLEAYDSSE